MKTLKKLKKQYDDICREYWQRLLEEVKKKLKILLARTNSKTISYADLCTEGHFDVLGKYETPKDYPGFYTLDRFGLDKSEKLYCIGKEISDDGEYTFSEYDLEISELEQVNEDLETILCNGGYEVDQETGEITYED